VAGGILLRLPLFDGFHGQDMETRSNIHFQSNVKKLFHHLRQRFPYKTRSATSKGNRKEK